MPQADSGDGSAPLKRRLLLGCGALLIGSTVLLAGTGYLLQRAYDQNVRRIAGALPAEPGRPGALPRHGENWLLIGSDRRADQPEMGARADSIMLVHLAADGGRVSVLAIPRDTWTAVPGHGRAKVNAAFALGGPALLVSAVERLTGVRVDHYAALDFGGFVEMTDALGGVDVTVAKRTRDPLNGGRTWDAGQHHLGGADALAFVRQRWNLPGGDLDRIKRQQAFLNALAGKAMGARNPIRIEAFVRAVSRSVSVDDSVSAGTLRGLAARLPRVALLEYLTVPVEGGARREGQDVVLLEQGRSARLFAAVRGDRIGDYLSRGGAANAVETVR